jgi:hypothetical protein
MTSPSHAGSNECNFGGGDGGGERDGVGDGEGDGGGSGSGSDVGDSNHGDDGADNIGYINRAGAVHCTPVVWFSLNPEP